MALEFYSTRLQDAVNWARNVNIHEIQAANGGG